MHDEYSEFATTLLQQVLPACLLDRSLPLLPLQAPPGDKDSYLQPASVPGVTVDKRVLLEREFLVAGHDMERAISLGDSRRLRRQVDRLMAGAPTAFLAQLPANTSSGSFESKLNCTQAASQELAERPLLLGTKPVFSCRYLSVCRLSYQAFMLSVRLSYLTPGYLSGFHTRLSCYLSVCRLSYQRLSAASTLQASTSALWQWVLPSHVALAAESGPRHVQTGPAM
jgi:hypothetical protein